ncbi:cytochrome P450 [Demequina aurantiaca]|uniref:cytochrome P450 n=1 Tax=Demequina aurantiaca TaxID=676200 RepID=UPI0007857E8F|nr:cytochrome P450 [Demequina aurantiaca]
MAHQTYQGRREVRGHANVRAALKDTETYSSDLLGDRDVRSYRQLPLEADPPRHTKYRQALQPLFMGDAIAPKAPRFKALARELIDGITARGGGELTTELALPYVIGCLTIVYERPQDYEEWLSWGPDVWTAEAYAKGEVSEESIRAQRDRDFDKPSQRSGAMLDDYLARVFDAAEAKGHVAPEDRDVWDQIVALEIDGERLTRDEMKGIANVLLAGGRDTVIKVVTGMAWHLMRNVEDRDYLTREPDAFNSAFAEMVRYLSPLSKMERVLPEDRQVPDAERDASRYVLMSYVSANYDDSVFPNPETLDLHRKRTPHLGFGFGKHSCMGMNIAEHETKAFLHTLLESWPAWEFDGEPEIVWEVDGEGADAHTILERFASVPVRVA